MTVTVPEFWQLVVASGLHDEADCRRLADAYATARDDGAIAKTVSLPEWIIDQGAITRYQAKILLAGKPGPFVYGDYLIADRCEGPGLNDLFRAVHRPTGAAVGLRFLAGATLGNPAIITALADQAAASGETSRPSPFLTHCHALIDLGTFKFFVVDEPPKATLAGLLANGQVSAKETLRFIWQVTRGLMVLHAEGRAHGEIRPVHIWVDKTCSARLTTFPLVGDPLAHIGANVNFGIDPAMVDYCPPEAADGEQITPAGDIYSLGCMFYQLFAGQVPFPNGDAQERLHRHRGETPRPLAELNSKIPKPITTLIAKMLAKEPGERFVDAAQFADKFGPIMQKLGLAGEVALPAARKQLGDWRAAQSRAAASTEAAMPFAVSTMLITPAHDETTSSAASIRPQKQRSFTAPVLIGVISALLIAIAAATIWGLAGGVGSLPAQPNVAAVAPAPRQTPAAPAAEAVVTETAGLNSETAGGPQEPGVTKSPDAPTEAVVGIDAPMWASPTHGPPLDLKYFSPGADVIVALRPAALVAQGESEKLLDPRTLGPLAEFLTRDVVQLVGPLAEIDQLLVGISETESGSLQVSLVARRNSPRTEEDSLAAWGHPEPVEKDGVKFFRRNERAYLIPATEGAGQTIVIGPADLVADEVIPAAGGAPALSQEVEALLAVSDAERQLTIIARPRTIVAEKSAFLPGIAARLRDPLEWFLGGNEPGAAAPRGASNKPQSEMRLVDISSQALPLAVLASAHLDGDNLFAELRVLVDPNRPSALVARDYRERVLRLPKRVSEYIHSLSISEYSRGVLWDFPLMLEQLARYTVAGTDGRQAVLRAYLPSAAAHNLALGSHLTLSEQPGDGAAPIVKQQQRPAAMPPAEPLAGRLDKRISLAGRLTLEAALQQVGEELGARVEILGPDLQTEGITKNQSFTISENDQPAREILRKVMLQANSDGKLIYVIRTSSEGAGETLYITTRGAAAQRGDPIPAELAEKR